MRRKGLDPKHDIWNNDGNFSRVGRSFLSTRLFKRLKNFQRKITLFAFDETNILEEQENYLGICIMKQHQI